jgi:hypothetical protein
VEAHGLLCRSLGVCPVAMKKAPAKWPQPVTVCTSLIRDPSNSFVLTHEAGTAGVRLFCVEFSGVTSGHGEELGGPVRWASLHHLVALTP